MRAKFLNFLKNALEKIKQFKNKIIVLFENCHKWAKLHPYLFFVIATVLIVFWGCIFNQGFRIYIIKLIMPVLSILLYPLNGLYSLSIDKNFEITKVKSFVEILKSLGLIIGGILGFLLAFLRFKIADKNHKLEKDSHSLELKKEVNQRFAKAVELLGNSDEAVRIGALYTLEQILKEETSYYDNCMDIITSYVKRYLRGSKILKKRQDDNLARLGEVKENEERIDYDNSLSGFDRQELEEQNDNLMYEVRKGINFQEEIVTAINILSRNSKENKKIKFNALKWDFVNFSNTDIEFKNIDFSYSSFYMTNFSNKQVVNCVFNRCGLEKVKFYNADLSGSDFRGISSTLDFDYSLWGALNLDKIILDNDDKVNDEYSYHKCELRHNINAHLKKQAKAKASQE